MTARPTFSSSNLSSPCFEKTGEDSQNKQQDSSAALQKNVLPYFSSNEPAAASDFKKLRSKTFVVRDPDILFRTGYSYYTRGSLCKAHEIFTQALACNPNHLQSLIRRGDISLAQGDYASAQQDFEASLAVDPLNSDAQLGLVNAFLMQGELQKGIDLLDQAIERSPDSIAPRLVRGEEIRKLQKYRESYEDFDKVVKQIERMREENNNLLSDDFSKKLAYAYGRRGVVVYRIDPMRVSEAINDFIKSHEIDADEAFVWAARGTVEFESQNYSSAKYFFKECVRRSPNHTHSLNCLGTIALLEKDDRLAVSYFEKSIRANRNNSLAYAYLGVIYGERDGNAANALEFLTKAIELDPENHFARFWIGKY